MASGVEVAASPGLLLDRRVVRRPLDLGVVTGRLDQTRIPGSYTIAVTASGLSQAFGTRFVRRDLLSVVVADRQPAR